MVSATSRCPSRHFGVDAMPRYPAARAADTWSRGPALRPITGASGSQRLGSRQEGDAEDHAVLQQGLAQQRSPPRPDHETRRHTVHLEGRSWTET
jgi:hypothetical protein